MTPALPGEAPDPSATPRLDALLKGVGAALETGHPENLEAVLDAAPSLAAMLRVAVEALKEITNADCYSDAVALKMTSLARIEAMAKGS